MVGTYRAANDRYLGVKGKTVHYNGGVLDLTGVEALTFTGDASLANMTLQTDASASPVQNSIFANGNTVTIDASVQSTGKIYAIYGGSNQCDVASANLTVCGGSYAYIIGGSNGGHVTGDTHLTVGGQVNPELTNFDEHSQTFLCFAGSKDAKVLGDTFLTVTGNAKLAFAFGGGMGAGAEVMGVSHVNVEGGKAISYYGGAKDGVVHNATLTMTGGEAQQLFGGSEDNSVDGSVSVYALGGKLTRRIYGGCYNDWGLSGYASDYSVGGTITVTIGDGLNFAVNYKYSDTGIIAFSRRDNDNSTMENGTLIFESRAKYENFKKNSLIGSSFWFAHSSYKTLIVAGVKQ